MQDNIYCYTDRSAVQEEAAAWLVRLDGDQQPSPEELDRLREWLSRSPVHRQALMDLTSFWNNQILTELSVPLEKQRDARRQHGARTASFVLGLAAAFVLIVLFLLAFHTLPWSSEHSTNGYYATAVGQQSTVALEDGSEFELNTDTQLEVIFKKTVREVRLLRGEAHFTVAKDVRRPFRVYVGNTRVEAVGTAFSVYDKDGAIEVLVTEGVVSLAAVGQNDYQGTATQSSGKELASPDEHVRELGRLTKGQKTTVKTTTHGKPFLVEVTQITPNEIGRALSWRKGYLTFSGEPLHQVVTEISRYTPVRIKIGDPSIENIQIGGQVPVEDPEAILDTFEANFGLKVTRLGYNYVQLSARSSLSSRLPISK